jgi:hypothetical protein
MKPKTLEFENFFEDPDGIRKFALSQKFYPSETHPTGGNWPGLRTEFYHTLNEDKYYDFTSKIYKVMGWKSGKESYFETMFQLCVEKDGTSWIHNDRMDQNFTHVGIVYLTPDAPKNAGTIFYEPKAKEDEARLIKEEVSDPDLFDEVAISENKYNKLIMYNPESWHKSDVYFGKDLYDGRLTLVAFFREDGASSKFSQPQSGLAASIKDLGFDDIPEDKVKKIEAVPKEITSRFSSATKEDISSSNLTILDYKKVEEKEWENKYLTPSAKSHEWELIADELGHAGHTQVFSWPLFTEDFCKEIIDTCESDGKWTNKRHEFYPTTDMLLEAVGLNDTYEKMLQKHCYPAAVELFGLEGKNWESLRGESFIIKYKSDGQPHLSFHHDYSKITFLVNLTQYGKDYEGGGTYFKRQKLLHRGERGDVTMHPGNITHKHGARPTTRGTRYVIVSFCNTKE